MYQPTMLDHITTPLSDHLRQIWTDYIQTAFLSTSKSHTPILRRADSIQTFASSAGGVYGSILSTEGLPEYCKGGVRNSSNNVMSSNSSNNNNKMKSEIAYRLAEGTIRTMRNLVLDEAADLHHALKFWSSRYEQPFLSYVEAGPYFRKHTYDHSTVGVKVSQIQAVLARRIGVIGELQQHLLRAGWQRGVAQWAVIGEGGEWIDTGEDGKMPDEQDAMYGINDESSTTSNLDHGSGIIANDNNQENSERKKAGYVAILRHSSTIGGNDNDDSMDATINDKNYSSTKADAPTSTVNYYGHSNIVVGNTRGGRIITDPCALTAWSIDAIRVVRDQLYRAGDFSLELPHASNWPQEEYYLKRRNQGKKMRKYSIGWNDSSLPLWAIEDSEIPCSSDHSISFVDNSDDNRKKPPTIVLHDIEMLSKEVNDLLVEIEEQIAQQRIRRFDKLKPPSRWRRNWYMVAIGAPVGFYIGYKLLKDRFGISLLKQVFSKMSAFYAEHVSEPITDIFNELFTSKKRPAITDQVARTEIEQSLKNMLKSWLDDQYPHTDEEWRREKAENMDMSLIEKKKEDNVYNALKSTFTGDIIRMALIEAQFIKKELMQAMKGIDEVMDSNELNFRLAATAPALMLMYGLREAAQFLFYALLKVGQSKESTYASFRYLMLEIERLLVMRDNPPTAPVPLEGGVYQRNGFISEERSNVSNSMLSTDDLGMLMLLIHECRRLVLNNRRRFSEQEIRNVLEDLAELSGERGCVTISQQLEIITRMSRVYSFMKVVSSGIPFDVSRLVAKV